MKGNIDILNSDLGILGRGCIESRGILLELFLHLTIKLIIGFLVLFIVTKFIGGREVKQLTVFDFISAIVLSELVGNVLYNDEANAFHMIFAISFWALLIFLVDRITLKSRKTRKLLDGEPLLIIEQSKIDKAILKKNNMDLNELLSLLRQKDIFSIREVTFGFLEPNGSLSIMKNSNPNNTSNQAALSVPLIIDGQLVQQGIQKIGKDKRWLEEKLQEQGFHQVEQIFYAEYKAGEELFVQQQP